MSVNMEGKEINGEELNNSEMNSKEMALLACKAIDEKKGLNILQLELGDVSLIADYFVICNGTSRTQTQAIADHVEEEMKKAGLELARREGYAEGKWVLQDYGAVIVHIFREEERQFYNLERLWGDATVVYYQQPDVVKSANFMERSNKK